mmetsp:Transcript_5360/g.14420  ORF Transcript_5360/g.14420 Transcript_5360/m.14420 type:complete len:368 (-) Transcript_5360:83-1186(-)|eukprot:CAMPEP_0202349532 /NCGR_PEP_ID=MMETSP1126-20121109/6987_1 /ASSEMBLY_ACC=CAM_ASM_000457 /TAXON_ID=3047 /ORGANISM="Dunaliella tertiolecta, Strain CCMP1320" /LENGTH=367 /DNA_ID=CAMNT_0048941363 /DNA_START=76 /DNA_END=1179 /DNA_ORIENTATION=+
MTAREMIKHCVGRLPGAQFAYNMLVKNAIALTELGYMPDFVLRAGIRQLLGMRASEACVSLEDQYARVSAFIKELRQMPIAISTDKANEQHYEVPTEYFLLCLGKHLKYSSCLYASPEDTLSQAEERMLDLSCTRAGLSDGQDILELGCGWGSFSLFAAAKFPSSSVTAVSNSRTQKEFIEARAQERGLKNLKVITANVVDFTPPGTYDRIVSIEMFEHMKNYSMLMARVASWLKPGGKLFVHIFVHKTMPYHFEDAGEDDWMSRYFFTGGTMPSMDLLTRFQEHLVLEDMWYVNGVNYSRTLEAWLSKHDAYRQQLMPVMAKAYGGEHAGRIWYNRWRVFYIACSELFGFNKGEEWGIGHYVFCKK